MFYPVVCDCLEFVQQVAVELRVVRGRGVAQVHVAGEVKLVLAGVGGDLGLQHRPAQYSTVQYSTVQYSTVQYLQHPLPPGQVPLLLQQQPVVLNRLLSGLGCSGAEGES